MTQLTPSLQGGRLGGAAGPFENLLRVSGGFAAAHTQKRQFGRGTRRVPDLSQTFTA